MPTVPTPTHNVALDTSDTSIGPPPDGVDNTGNTDDPTGKDLFTYDSAYGHAQQPETD